MSSLILDRSSTNYGSESLMAGIVRRGELKRALGLMDCMLLVVGGIIGSGIFLTPSNIAQNTQNVGAFFFVWIAGGVLSFCGAMTFAELGAAFPKAGGIYVFLREAYGQIPAFLYGGCVFFTMANEGLFFRRIAYVHPRYRVPTISILATGVWASFLTLIGSFERLFSYVMFVSWIFFALGAGAVLVLRRKQPNRERPYEVWGYPWVPMAFILAAVAFVINAMANNFKNTAWGLLVIITGVPAYFYWSRRQHTWEKRP